MKVKLWYKISRYFLLTKKNSTEMQRREGEQNLTCIVFFMWQVIRSASHRRREGDFSFASEPVVVSYIRHVPVFPGVDWQKHSSTQLHQQTLWPTPDLTHTIHTASHPGSDEALQRWAAEVWADGCFLSHLKATPLCERDWKRPLTNSLIWCNSLHKELVNARLKWHGIFVNLN